MSKSDHSKSRKQERPGAMRINGELYAVPRRWHAEPIEREAIEASIADNGFVVRRRNLIASHVDHPLAQPVHYTSETTHDAPVSPFAALVDSDKHTPVRPKPRKRVQHVHRDTPIASYGDTTGNRMSVIDQPEPPSLMQMAKARAAALGL
jgi:hypothetical protein